MRQRDFEQRSRLRLGEGCGRSLFAAATQHTSCGLVVGEGRNVVASENVIDERDVLRGNELSNVVECESAGVASSVFCGHDEVDAIRSVTHLFFDPREVDRQLFGRVGDGSENSHTAGPRNGGDHVAAVGEGENGNIDSEKFGNGSLHSGTPLGLVFAEQVWWRLPMAKDSPR